MKFILPCFGGLKLADCTTFREGLKHRRITSLDGARKGSTQPYSLGFLTESLLTTD
jgi:hypothetical protein